MIIPEDEYKRENTEDTIVPTDFIYPQHMDLFCIFKYFTNSLYSSNPRSSIWFIMTPVLVFWFLPKQQQKE